MINVHDIFGDTLHIPHFCLLRTLYSVFAQQGTGSQLPFSTPLRLWVTAG